MRSTYYPGVLLIIQEYIPRYVLTKQVLLYYH